MCVSLARNNVFYSTLNINILVYFLPDRLSPDQICTGSIVTGPNNDAEPDFLQNVANKKKKNMIKKFVGTISWNTAVYDYIHYIYNFCVSDFSFKQNLPTRRPVFSPCRHERCYIKKNTTHSGVRREDMICTLLRVPSKTHSRQYNIYPTAEHILYVQYTYYTRDTIETCIWLAESHRIRTVELNNNGGAK